MKKKQHTTAFYIETLLMILVFIGIILVLSRVFGSGQRMSIQAKTLTNAVTLAGNAAEAVSASESPAEVAEYLGDNAFVTGTGVVAFYDTDMKPYSGENAPVQVDISWEPEDGEGGYVNSTISVYAFEEEHPVYVLETAVYTGEVGE
ncbi:MAG: hypothetical protein IKG08_02525 [Eubacterium sp.]|nr:hypothetical protein [Eubacterium sp.]